MSRAILRAFFLAIALALSAPAAADVVHVDQEIGAEFPSSFGAFKFERKHVYEQAILGYSLNYRSMFSKTLMSVYVYGEALKIPEGAESRALADLLQRELQGIDYARSKGAYRSVKVLPAPKVDHPAFLAASMEIIDNKGLPASSHIYLRGEAGYVLKVRVSTLARQNIEPEIDRALDAILKALRKRR